jgi:hypothetical protein
MVTDSPVSFLLVPVVDVFVLGSPMGVSGKEKMMCLETQSDVSRVDQQMTVQLQVTPLLRTDSVGNSMSTHDSPTRRRHTREFYSLMLHVPVSTTSAKTAQAVRSDSNAVAAVAENKKLCRKKKNILVV